jgi:surface antigen
MQDLPLFNVSQNINKPIIDKLTVQVQPKEEPKTIQHTVVEGESLSKIAKQYNTTWQRLWQRNTNLNNQDMLVVGEKLTIPHADEIIADRPLYTLPVQQKSAEPIKYAPQGNSGNDMDYGYCTWFVKNLRPDLPKGLGNANTWYARASAWGLPVGSVPRVGAVATTTRGYYGHVSLVTGIEGDLIHVTEMNVAGFGVQSNGTYPASEYLYIY